MAESTPSSFTVMTDAGLALVAQLAGKQNSVKSLRVVASDTSHWNDEQDTVAALTTLDSVKQEGVIADVFVPDNKSNLTIQADFDQSKITTAYQLNSVGLYATDANGTEILYAVECLQHPQYMDVSTTADMNSHYITIAVGNASQVNIEVSTAGSVSKNELATRLLDYPTNESLTKVLGDYSKTADVTKLLGDYEKSADTVNFADTTKANTFTQPQTLAGGAVDADGNSFVTEDKVPKPDLSGLQPKGDYAAAADLTALKSTVNSTTTGLPSKASATDLTALAAKVNDTTNGIGTKASEAEMTALKTAVNSTSTGLPSKASASDLTALTAKVTSNTTNIGKKVTDNADGSVTVNGAKVVIMQQADVQKLIDAAVATATTTLKKYADDAKQGAIDQIQPMITAEFTKRNAPSSWWNGDATAYAAITPKVADAEYDVTES